MVVNDSKYLTTMCYFCKSKVRKFNSEANTYYVGKWCEIPAALVQQTEQWPSGSESLVA